MLLSYPGPLAPCEDTIRGEAICLQSWRQLSPEPHCLGTMILDFQPPELEETIVESHLVYGSFCYSKELNKTSLIQYAVYLISLILSSHSCIATASCRTRFMVTGMCVCTLQTSQKLELSVPGTSLSLISE